MDKEDGTRIVTAAVPVAANDATRCEALGPALASLLLARFPGSSVRFEGDSMMVCKLLRRELLPKDIWLYNSTSITHDMLTGHRVSVNWIPREQNSECDALARQAVVQGCLSVDVHEAYAVAHARVWKSLCRAFVKRFNCP